MIQHTLKFGHASFHTAMKSHGYERLAATTRYDDEKNIEEGNTLEITKAGSGIVGGYADVRHVEMVELRDALPTIDKHGAMYAIDLYSDLISAMHAYYDASITAKTYVKVIIFQTTELQP